MKKLWFVGMVVLVVVLVAGAAGAQMDPGPFHILHKYGAIFNSDTGWTLSTPPYYPGTEWAVDFVYNSQGMSILHKDGAIWNENTGWDYTAYYSGSAYSKALEYLRPVTGCWGLKITEFETYYNGTVSSYVLWRDMEEYPDAFIQIESQTGTRFYGKIVFWDGELCDEIPFEGTIIGDHFTAVGHNFEGTAGVDECEVLDVIVGLVFWDDVDLQWELKGSIVGADVECVQNDEAGFFGAFIAWPETVCDCPPPQ